MAGDPSSQVRATSGSPGHAFDRRLSATASLDGSVTTGGLPAASAARPGSSGTRRAAHRSPGGNVGWPILLCIAIALMMSASRSVSAQHPGSVQSVCDRTYQVSDAIVTASGAANCSYVTLHHLREVTALDLSNQSIVSLSAGDFDGLVRLDFLDLSGNFLTTLPEGVFDELLLVRSLRLDGNQLRSLPVDLFEDLVMLEGLTLHANPLLRLSAPGFGNVVRFAGTQDDLSDVVTFARTEDNVDLPQWGVDAGFLDRFLEGVYTAEDFIAALPALYKERFAMVFSSESPARDYVSRDYPRIVSWGGDGRFTFSWNTNPSAPAQFTGVEFLRRGDSAWSAGVIDFSGASPTVTEPALCQTCHGPLNKPLWGGFAHWDGTENSSSSDIQATNSAAQSTNPRIQPLDCTASEYVYGTRTLKTSTYDFYVTPVEEAGNILAWRHAEVLHRRLKARRDFRQFAETAVCTTDSDGARAAVLRPFELGDHNLAVLSDTGQVIQGGSANRNQYVLWDYHYGEQGALGGALLFLVVVDLWEQEPIVRKLYRDVSNSDTLPENRKSANHSTLLYYASGSANAEDELIAKLRLHFGQGSRRALEERARQNTQVPTIFGGAHSAYFVLGHLEVMAPRVCNALRNTKPKNLRVEIVDGDAVLDWEAPADGDSVTGYRILRGVDGEPTTMYVEDTVVTATTWADNGLASGDYVWIVQALFDSYPSPKSNAVRATVSGPPLTASFHGMPTSHNGTTPFTFELRFSEQIEISYVTLRDSAFTVTNGEVTRVRRLNPPSNLRWFISVEPKSAGDITIALPGNRSCDVTGAVCTAGGKKLSNSPSATVR